MADYSADTPAFRASMCKSFAISSLGQWGKMALSSSSQVLVSMKRPQLVNRA